MPQTAAEQPEPVRVGRVPRISRLMALALCMEGLPRVRTVKTTRSRRDSGSAHHPAFSICGTWRLRFRSDAQREGSSEQPINTSGFDGAAPALREHAQLTPGCCDLLLARTAHSGKNRFGHLVLGTPSAIPVDGNGDGTAVCDIGA